MKHLPIIVLLSITAFCGILEANAYEVYEHNTGDQNHLVPESKVMKANVACVGNLYFYRTAAGDIAIDYRDSFKGDYDLLCDFNPKDDGSYVFTQPGEISIANTNFKENFRQEVNVFYDPSGTSKRYRIIVTSFEGKTIEVEGMPTFYKGDDLGTSLEVIGSEKSVGTQPVFLEWLGHWAKKLKFKSINSD